MRLLIVTCEFAPNANPRALRWTALAEYWAKQGHRVDVVCGVPTADHTKDEIESLLVHRAGIGLLSRLRQRFGSSAVATQQRGAAEVSAGGRLARRTMSALGRLYRLAWKPFQWPDYAAAWYRPARDCAGGLLERSHYDALVTVSNPFTSHRVGLALKDRFPAVRWIADVGDPFSIDERFRANNRWLYASRNRRFERNVVHAADAVTIVTETMTDAYRRQFPLAASRMQTVQPLAAAVEALPRGGGTPGANPKSETPRHTDRDAEIRDSDWEIPSDFGFRDSDVTPTHRPSPRRLAYFGTLYRRLRSPHALLALFRLLVAMPGLHDLELHFYGNTSDCDAEFDRFGDLLGTKVHRHGPVPGKAVAGMMRDCHVLVNIGNDLPYGLPSKLVEYAATGRPILNIRTCAEDTSSRFLAGYPAALTLSADDVSAGRLSWLQITEFLHHPPAASPQDVDRLLRPHRLEAVAEQYEQAICGKTAATKQAA